MRILLSWLLCVLPPAVVAQNAPRVAGPVSGIVYDRASASLRPMVGVPGASYLGDAVLTGLEAASVSPDGEMALAISEGRLLLVSGLKTTNPSSTVVNALAGDRFVWSPDASSAAVYSTRAGQAQVLRDLRGNLAPGALIDVPGAVSSLALSDAGDLAVGLDAGVALLAPGAAPRMLSSLSATALAVSGRNLFAAGNGEIRLLENFAASPSASLFAGDAGTVVGLQISGKRLFAADSAGRMVTAWDLATRAAVAQVQLECAPSELRAFGGQAIWLLNSDSWGPDPLYVATGDGDPATYFVPAGRAQ